jgi:DNA-binding CsgD family transcriptional regulator
MCNASLSIKRVRSILEISGTLARQPSVLARQLEQLTTDLGTLLSADMAFACAIEDGLSDPHCLITRAPATVESGQMFYWLAKLSTIHPVGTRTIRADRIGQFMNGEGFGDTAVPAQVMKYPAGVALCFRRESKRVICLALLRDSVKHPFPASDLATIDLVVGWGWVPAAHRAFPGTATGRQRELLDLLKSGHSEKEAAQKLQISFHTVHVHVKKIYQRFGVSSRHELLSLWIH